MAALALPTARTLFPALRLQFSRPLFVASASAAPVAFGWSLGSTWETLRELIPPFLLAVPKKKTSHSRKSMRSANKGLKDKENLVHCPGCGSAKLAHHLCPTCYSNLSREWKAKARKENQSSHGVVSVD